MSTPAVPLPVTAGAGTIVDLFAGIGGWDATIPDAVGIESDPDACATRHAAGLLTIRGDVTRFDPGPLDGLVASPPCQLWSDAGGKSARASVDALHAHVVACADAWRPWTGDPAVGLVLEPLRVTLECHPRWVAFEQVPPVLELWDTIAAVLERHGWRSWAGVLNAADYGIPQTRRRAFLLANRDRRPYPPPPTHTDGQVTTLFGELAPWVSMADALGWGGEDTPARTVCGHRAPRWMYPDDGGRRGRMVDRRTNSRGPGGVIVPTVPVPVTEPAPTLTTIAGGQWVIGADAGTTKLTVTDALVLQSFPPDYPVQGNKTAAFRQVGNAVPPRLAAAVLEAVRG